MKKLLLFLAVIISIQALGQEKILYDTQINGVDQIKKAIAEAKQSNKQVLIQVGGNWCPWCIKFHQFIGQVPKIDSIIKASYVYIPLNYSRENKNEEAMKQLEYPQRFGFPVLVILDKNGKRLHTQDSGLLEKDKGYDTTKVVTFLNNWTIKALDPETYVKH